ncbi:MAG: single-stranded DNA-binding protein [Syntrophomonadaceae bacterium]|jgi:single-strand DNA-binding protein|nr:single-stranded DNA-binding protein [Syntrophomonadaceae bacterium]
MLNKVILIGRLTRDPELRYTPNGVAVATFSLAVDRSFVNQQGQREADFIRVKVWRKLAEVVANNLGKGRLVAVEGRLEVRSYDAQDGTKRYETNVVADEVRFLDWPKEGQGGARQQFAGDDPFGSVNLATEEDLPF